MTDRYKPNIPLSALLLRERLHTRLRYPVVLHTEEYMIDEGRMYEWVQKLVYVQESGKPVYTTGLEEIKRKWDR